MMLFAHKCAGHFGFQRDMRAIDSLWEPGSEDNCNVRALLDSTAEVVQRARVYACWWHLWRADVRAGWVAFGRYKVRGSLRLSTRVAWKAAKYMQGRGVAQIRR